MKVKNFRVVPCGRLAVKDFIEFYHYSGSINGVNSDYHFQLADEDGNIIGAALFGALAMKNQYKRFSDNENDVTELRRLCCIDDTPKNTESFFIGKMLKWLKDNTELQKIVSYSDLEYGHDGTIYKASNFSLVGTSPPNKVIMWNGKKYHDRSLRAKHNGVLKPFAVKLREALANGEATEHMTKGKNVYVYELRNKNRSL